MNHFRSALKKDDEGFALLSVILLMTVVTFFAIVLLGLAVSQTSPTLLTNKNSRTQTAAQAGIDATVAQLRNAQTVDSGGVLMGDIHKLPCTVTGTVDGTGGATRYAATVQYFSDDPTSQSDSWRTANALTCYTGTGNNGGIRAVAHFALISSQGLDDAATVKTTVANRILEATYTFQLTTRKVSGGQILDSSSQYCLVATGKTAGSSIQYQAASSAACATSTDFNSWSWRDDYMVHLTATDLGGSTPMCLTGRPNPNPVKATLQKCTTLSNDPNGQRWRWTGDYTWQGQDAANSSTAAKAYVVNQDNKVDAGDYLYVSNALGNQSLTPTGAVGKAGASYATHQVVNQTYFGRCLDVTNQNIWYGYMIAFPCKQDPSGALNFDWNHKWYYDEPDLGVDYVNTQISVINGSTYCLMPTTTKGLKSNSTNKSPTPTTYTAKFPRFVVGDKTTYASNCAAADTTWRRYGYNTDYTKAYTFYDATNNLCLSAAGPFITEDGGAGTWTSIIEEPCDGSDNQKWNVPDTPVTASVGDYQETTGR